MVGHAIVKLQAWESEHVRGNEICATPAQIAELQSIWSSYCGHFQHANSSRLRRRLEERFPWLATVMLPRRPAVEQLHAGLRIVYSEAA